MKIIQLYILFISLIYLEDLSFAQQSDSIWSIKGKVLSAKNLEPIEECLVQLRHSGLWTQTDSCGHFEFYGLNSTAYRLVVSNIGYFNTDTLIQRSAFQEEYVIYLIASCFFDKAKAIQDIKDKKPKLLLVGSIAPVHYPDDEDFEKEYDVKFYDFGCTPPAFECIREYNQTIFEYLDSKYGKSWRKEVRKDVCFLNNTKR